MRNIQIRRIQNNTETITYNPNYTIDLQGMMLNEQEKEYVKKGLMKFTIFDKLYFYFPLVMKLSLLTTLVFFILAIVGIYNSYADDSISYDNLTIVGMEKPPKALYLSLKETCTLHKVKSVKHCVKTGLSIAYAESSWKDLKTPFGLQSKDKSVNKWVKSYKKYWYKAKDGFFFYGDLGKYGPSRYCTSEESSGSKVGCPNGKNNFNLVFHNLYF